MIEYLKKYENMICNCKDKEEMKKIVRTIFKDNNINDIDFNDLIYDNVIPKLKELGVNVEYDEETSETNYERIMKENY